MKISAAVFGDYPGCRESVAQDWPKWIEAGYLDFVCPMDYRQSDFAFSGLVSNQVSLIKRQIPFYPGIGKYHLPDHRAIGQIFIARQLGADGFTVFDLSPSAAQSFVPTFGLGAGSEAARPPHQTE